MQILHETMSMPMLVKRIAGKIGSVRRSTVAIQNDYKTNWDCVFCGVLLNPTEFIYVNKCAFS